MCELASDPPARLVATAELPLSETDWPRFRAVLADFAARGGWAMSDCPQPRALGGSLSRAGGAHLAYRQWRWPDRREARATLYVVAPDLSDLAEGPDWRRALFRRLSEEWPGGLAVTEASGPRTSPAR